MTQEETTGIEGAWKDARAFCAQPHKVAVGPARFEPRKRPALCALVGELQAAQQVSSELFGDVSIVGDDIQALDGLAKAAGAERVEPALFVTAVFSPTVA